MTKRSLLLIIYVWTAILAMAQTFSFSDKKNGFAYTPKGDCLLMTEKTNANITFTTQTPSIYNCKCYKITFTSINDSLTSDTIVLSKSKYTVSADSLTLTLKKIDANAGYLVTYGDSSCNNGAPCQGFTWVTEFLPLESVQWEKDEIVCSDLELTLSPVMTYRGIYGNEKKIERDLHISYKSFLNNNNKPDTMEVNGSYSESKTVTLDQMPYVNTTFTIIDSTNVSRLDTIVTDTFFTQAVVAYASMSTSSAYEHEADEGTDTINYFTETHAAAISNAQLFRSSAPLTLMLYSNANEMANHYEWAIASGTEANVGEFKNAFVLFGKDINSYKMSDPELYCIELTVSNIRNDSVCEHKSYTCFRIAESALKVPNAFTPNGDGSNDEFRVAYRSIEEFECHIYDRWGRKVYESNDITQGWDGYVHNKLASIGTYFYLIKAKGTDGVEYKKKGTVNLIRSKED